jgi:hypothetical protein
MVNRADNGSSSCLQRLLKSSTEAAVRTGAAVRTAASYLYRNQSSDDNPDLSLKITRDLARAFLMQTALTVLQPDFLNSKGKSDHDVSSHFLDFGCFLSLTALMTQIL